LTSSYLGATHIHYDDLQSIDCKVHILVKNLNSTDTPNGSFELLECEVCFESIGFVNRYLIQALIKGFDAQAPPSIS
jgi:hypothetical protein